MPRPSKRKTPSRLPSREVWIPLIPFALVFLWALVDILRSYPGTFYPSYWDEAVYAMEAIVPKVMFAEFSTAHAQYAAVKLGYGVPLAGSVALFGDNGMMYLSTLSWLATIVIVARHLYRHFGAVTAAFAATFLTFVPFFTKYAIEVGPTTMSAFAFALLWIVYPSRKFWLSGIVIGYLAMVDFKWAPPAAMCVLLIEATVEYKRTVRNRLLHVLGIGGVALGLLAFAMLAHPPYWDYLSSHTVAHSKLEGYFPSVVFGYYLWLFGAAPVAALSILALIIPGVWSRIGSWDMQKRRVLFSALIFGGVPILFYSLLGELKPLRFFAVTFPIMAAVQAILIGSLWEHLRTRFSAETPARRRSFEMSMTVALAAAIVISSDGPALSYRLPRGIQEARERVGEWRGREGGISSYIWPVTLFRQTGQSRGVSFAIRGLQPFDQWLILNPVADQITIEMRIDLGETGSHPDSVRLSQSEVYRWASDSLFSLPSDFYSSDYFFAENAVSGISTLRRWQALRQPGGDFLTVYKIDQQKASTIQTRSAPKMQPDE